MTLEDLGYTKDLEQYRKEQGLESFQIGRIISEHKERYVVKTIADEYDAEIIGNLRFTAQSRADFPAVGDWVAISEYDEDKMLIHKVFPRETIIERQAVGKQGEKQIIATNIDYALIVQAVDRDFNINRIERYLTICNASKVKAIIILNKIDLIDDHDLIKLMNSVAARISKVPIIPFSNKSLIGISSVKQSILKGKTYCLLGSSGVGKSTLLNTLTGRQHMKTNTIGESTNRGRHITTHRELVMLDEGGIIIDNPGMREVGITDASKGLELTFDAIMKFAQKCKFKDCTHTGENGCTVIAAVEQSEIDESSYDNYLRMEREKTHFESSVAEKQKKDKYFGKMIKQVLKNKRDTQGQ